ncbi:MAG: hypothetical protein SRB1_02033 [Desulfobacteraceae bacterium Eth-SRB1]|nr:MAG: hypothetical protein SRB1_02033 [Desulfobacteraceae bacterium Eth-SRB1]
MSLKILERSQHIDNSIQSLFLQAFKKAIDISSFRNWYSDNPSGKIIEFGEFHDNQLIAYNYIFPQHYNGEVIYLSGGSMVDRNYTGLFIPFFITIENYLKKKCILLYAFCNKNSFPIFNSKLFRWKYNPNYKHLILTKSKQPVKINKETIERISFKNFVYLNNSKNNFMKRRDDWILWRLSKPNTDYKILKYNNIFVIFKKYGDQVDLISILNCKDQFEYIDILNKVYNYLQDNGISKKISLIFSTQKMFKLIQKYFEYQNENYERHLCYKTLNASSINFEEDFFIEMIDSDVF